MQVSSGGVGGHDCELPKPKPGKRRQKRHVPVRSFLGDPTSCSPPHPICQSAGQASAALPYPPGSPRILSRHPTPPSWLTGLPPFVFSFHALCLCAVRSDPLSRLNSPNFDRLITRSEEKIIHLSRGNFSLCDPKLISGVNWRTLFIDRWLLI